MRNRSVRLYLFLVVDREHWLRLSWSNAGSLGLSQFTRQIVEFVESVVKRQRRPALSFEYTALAWQVPRVTSRVLDNTVCNKFRILQFLLNLMRILFFLFFESSQQRDCSVLLPSDAKFISYLWSSTCSQIVSMQLCYCSFYIWKVKHGCLFLFYLSLFLTFSYKIKHINRRFGCYYCFYSIRQVLLSLIQFFKLFRDFKPGIIVWIVWIHFLQVFFKFKCRNTCWMW
jgi:hypothetical protein